MTKLRIYIFQDKDMIEALGIFVALIHAYRYYTYDYGQENTSIA